MAKKKVIKSLNKKPIGDKDTQQFTLTTDIYTKTIRTTKTIITNFNYGFNMGQTLIYEKGKDWPKTVKKHSNPMEAIAYHNKKTINK